MNKLFLLKFLLYSFSTRLSPFGRRGSRRNYKRDGPCNVGFVLPTMLGLSRSFRSRFASRGACGLSLWLNAHGAVGVLFQVGRFGSDGRQICDVPLAAWVSACGNSHPLAGTRAWRGRSGCCPHL